MPDNPNAARNIQAMLKDMVNAGAFILVTRNVPINGITFAGVAGNGTLLIHQQGLSADLYINISDKNFPIWKKFTRDL